MKIISKLIKTLLIITIPTSILLSGCGAADVEGLENVAPEEPEAIVRGESTEDQAIFESKTVATGSNILLSVFDAETQQLIDQPVNFFVVDLSKSNALEIEGDLAEPNTQAGEPYSFNRDNGTLAIALKSEISDATIDFRFNAFSDNYISSGTSATVETKGESKLINLFLVSKSNPPEFIDSSTQSTNSNAAGELSQAVTVAVSDSTDAEAGTSLSIPAGTPLTTENGSAISAGRLNVDITYFNPNNPNIADIFPGGLSFDADTEGADEAGYFITAGLVSIEVTDSEGNSVQSLGNQGATLTLSLPNDLINPDTGNPIQAGETIPLWQRDNQTGQWTLVGSGDIALVNNQLEFSSTVDTAGYWHIGWYTQDSLICEERIVRLKDSSGNNLNLDHQVIYLKYSNSDFQIRETSSVQNPVIRFYNQIGDGTSTFKAFLNFGDSTALATAEVTGCNDVRLQFDLPQTKTFELSLNNFKMIAPPEVNYYEVEKVLKEANIVRADREGILEITHPGSRPELRDEVSETNYPAIYDIRTTRIVMSDIYQFLLDNGIADRDQVATIQTVLALEFLLKSGTVYYYYYPTNSPINYQQGSFNLRNTTDRYTIELNQQAQGKLLVRSEGFINNADGEESFFEATNIFDLNLRNDASQNNIEATLYGVYGVAASYNALVSQLEEQ